MSEAIKDGTGNGYLAEVSHDNKLRTRSITETRIQHATELGNAYNINTGDIGSLATGESALIYFKNNEDLDFSVDAIAVGIKDASGSNIHTVTVVKNPTAGTIVSGATDVDMNTNRNFGSAASLSQSLAYKGANGLTLTGGEDIAIFYMNESGRLFATADFVIPKSKSVGIKIDFSLSSGTTTAYVALIGHQEEII
jgi:hypothetical protein